MKQILYYLIAGTKGGITRAIMIKTIMDTPMNAHQLSKHLDLDYTTIKHHLKILEKNDVLSTLNKGTYGAMFFISEQMKENISYFDEIWSKFRKE